MSYASQNIRKEVIESIEKALGRALLENEIQLSTPPKPEMGDVAFGCFVLAKKEKKDPALLAQELAGKILKTAHLEKISAEGPYVNIGISLDVYTEEIGRICKAGKAYGQAYQDTKETVMVEFGQPNTHKAFHVGHLKSAISGLGVVRLLENLGYTVIKTNYYGDIGMHVAKSTWGLKKKGVPDDFDTWDVHERMRYIDDGYVKGSQAFENDEKAAEEIKKINNDVYAGTHSEEYELYERIRTWSTEHLMSVFRELGIEYDKQYPESDVYEDALKIVQEHKGDLFTESDGALIYDGEKEGLTTWVFLTREGNPTYSAKDLALGIKKFNDYKLDKNITLTSVEQVDYFKVVIKCLETIQPDIVGKYIHLPFGWLLRDNKKTSSREGGTIKGMDVINEARNIATEKIDELKEYSDEDKKRIAKVVANAGLKFMILSHEFHKNINYDPKKFISFEGFAGPYVLYAYVRTRSLLRKGRRSFFRKQAVLSDEAEIVLAKKLAEYPDVAERAGHNLTPHTVCTYIHEVASLYNAFYANCPVLDASTAVRNTRLDLTEATSHVLKNGLSLLGIDTIEEM